MNIKRRLKSIALAVGLATVGTVTAGDIYEILPCRENTLGQWETVSSTDYVTRDGDGVTVDAGVDLSFKVRLAPRVPKVFGDENWKTWQLANVGGLLNELDQNRLALAIYVGGRLDWAVNETYQTSSDGVLDLIFTYRTKPGDMGLPILLAVKDSITDLPVAAHRNSTGSTLYLKNMDKWSVTDGVNECDFSSFGVGYENPSYNTARPASASLTLSRDTDISLRNCGFAVKTVDFAADWEQDGAVWRTVKQGSSTIASFKDVKLQLSSPADAQVDLYVWSDDDTIVDISPNRANTEVIAVETLQLTMADGSKKQTRAAKIRFVGGAREASFRIYGVAQNPTPCNLVLSNWTDYHYDVSNNRLEDYMTVPVVCGEPERPSIRVTRGKATLTATADEAVAADILTITRTGDYAEPITVTLTPSFECDAAKDDWYNYVRFSTTEGETLPTSTTVPTVTIPAGSGGDAGVSVPLYVYALRSDEFTKGDGHKIMITPTIDAAVQAAAGITELVETGFNIKAQNPEIVAPTESSSALAVTSGEELEIPVEIRDTYADRTEATGYTVFVKFGAGWEELPEKFKYDDGALVGLTSGKSPSRVCNATAGDQVFQIRVVAPVSGLKSESSFNVKVAAAKTVSVSTTDDTDTYVEGATVPFAIDLSEPVGKKVYAFLLSDDPDIDLSKFGGTAAQAFIRDASVAGDGVNGGRKGLTVGPSVPTVTGSFTVLDAAAEIDGGNNYIFSVVFCESQTYDPDKRVPGYPSTGDLNITVYNKEPIVDSVRMAGREQESGSDFGQFPKNQKWEIQPIITDATYDLNHGFTYRWNAYCNSRLMASGTMSHRDPVPGGDPEDVIYTDSEQGGIKVCVDTAPDGKSINKAPFKYDFPEAGNWTVKIEVKDKDMGEVYSKVAFTFSLTVIDNPAVQLEVESSYLETDVKNSRLRVGLGYYEGRGTPMVVKLTVTPPPGDNPGVLKLSEEYKIVPGLPGEYDDLAENEYYVSFTGVGMKEIAFEEMDGTFASSSKGFVVKAEVVTKGKSVDPTQQWFEYYLPAQEKVYIENVEPVVTMPAENESTNGWTYAKSITWNVRNDVDYDFTTKWTDGGKEVEGIKVEITGDCENGEVVYVTEKPTRKTFTPNFGSQQGDLSVTITISDKDSDNPQEFTYYYKIPSSKYLRTTATGPSGGTTTSALSQRYAKAKGIGAGHTYVGAPAKFQSATGFTRTWNLGRETSAIIYGFGYSLGAIDNGSLNGGKNWAVDGNGNNQNTTISTLPDATAYHYTDEDERDSFFYCWLYSLKEKDSGNGATVEVLGNTAAPEIRGEIASGIVDLPTESTDDDNFPLTLVEGVFSREWRKADNVGDINFDGVPDIFAFRNWGGGNLIDLAVGGDGEDRMANDLMDLAATNPDEDLLPGVLNQDIDNANFVMSARTSYAPVGLPFTTRDEIRGFGDGLNATDLGKMVKSDPDFSETEMAAWRAFCIAEGMIEDDDAVETPAPDLSKWSPEPGTPEFPRLDPTMDDTDGDGRPDGWEYFFWYQAHVWKPAGADQASARPGQQFVFERFNLNNILVGTEIPAAEVEHHFNPCRTLTKEELKKTPDFDGDGLSDLEELVLGTNPCHWDTDGDHLCDGWEVMMSLDPLNTSKDTNPDGDFMAYYTTYGQAVAYTTDDEEMGIYSETAVISVIPFQPGDVDGEGKLTREVTAMGFSFTPKMYTHVWADGSQSRLNLLYGLADDDPGEHGEEKGWGYRMVDNIHRGKITLPEGTPVTFSAKFVLIHDQVHDAFDFDPRTGWFATSRGYVADRWDPTVNTSLVSTDTTGAAVNTRAYCTYDEYLVMKYRADYGIAYTPDDPVVEDPWTALARKTTNPSVILAPVAAEGEEANGENTDNTDNGDETEVAQQPDRTTVDISNAVADAFQAAGSNKTPAKGHGADTDGDGVPDGWELYMYRNPNAAPDAVEDGLGMTLRRDFDNDSLSYAAEYAGTDSCNAYAGCASIYANHPGNRTGWFNKFFPTNPGTRKDGEGLYAGNDDGADTDGDGVTDAAEGSTWVTDFYMGGKVYPVVMLGAIYGTPADAPNLCCIRGGGMNPCTIDTDQDGLPDGWEMQHIGVPLNATTRTLLPPRNGDIGGIELDPLTLIADGLFDGETAAEETTATNENAANEAETEENAPVKAEKIYLAGGMDPTWDGDPAGSAIDPLLNTLRDLDFDHDGLQNYQEYLVQSLRHLRYDDTMNKLMGRELSGDDGARKQKFDAYEPFDSAREFELAEEEDLEQFRSLGYFVTPVRAWDRSNVSDNFMDPVYMLPVTGTMQASCAGYVSTDPRMADTDGDSMDDYYELFHGLNPLLGTIPEQPASSTWSGGKKGDIISAVYDTIGRPTMLFNGYYNAWIYPSYSVELAEMGLPPCDYKPIQPPVAFDPILYPWIMGSPTADADGDGIRNYSEGIAANLANPAPTHTDPTPLWFTDSSAESSFTAQYYGYSPRVAAMAAGWSPTVKPLQENDAALNGMSPEFMFGFEENEGYDTDNDMVPDSREVVTTATTATDPLRFDDPDRRQALWLNGTDAFAMSRDLQYRAIGSQDLLKQFTVECWVRPEKRGEQTIIDRSCAYNGDAINKDQYAIRSNFRIGLRASGHVYGMFDNNDSIESGVNYPVSCQRVEGTELPLNEWSHVALTFDGKALAIYVNGNLISSAQTTLIPANGVMMNYQNPSTTNTFPTTQYAATPSAFYIGARPQKQALEALDPAEAVRTFLYEYYQGYVDEVRVWDGALKLDDIRNNYLKRFTFADVAANRDAVYMVWKPGYDGKPGGTRNENDGRAQLPPELVFHYNFQTLPGALNAADVIKAPVGFEANVLKAAMNDYASNADIDPDGLYINEDMGIKNANQIKGLVEGDLLVGWWSKCPMRSTVYNDYHVVPWIENTVAHLPLMDGGCLDSFLYNENTGGSYLPAAGQELEKFIFPNSAIPYASTVFGYERLLRLMAAQRLGEAYGVPYTDILDRYRFQLRGQFTGTADLVPMGGAFAKACPEMWDGFVSDAWEYTVSDANADGLPDWWEEYARHNYCPELDPSEPLNWDTKILKDGLLMSASQAYLIDLALGLQPDGTFNSDYAATADGDHNGVPDWWEKLFGVQGAELLADSDNDGLSDYAEYLLSFVFKLGQIFDPRNPHSADHNDIDYFFPIGQLYAGEIFSDGDFMEDSWEQTYTAQYVNPFVWDANSDKDEDGWSAFAECRYNNFVSTIVADKISHMLGDMEMKDFPIPTLKLTLRYNLSQMLGGGADVNANNNGNGQTADNQEENVLAPIVVKTYTHKGTQEDNVVPDATFTIRPGEEVDRVHYLGMWGERVARGSLTPGYVEPGSVTLEMAHVAQNNNYTWSVTFNGEAPRYRQGTYAAYLHDYQMYGPQMVELQAEAFAWSTFQDENALTVSQDGDKSQGYIRIRGERVGTIDTQTGEFALDMTPLGQYALEGTNAVYSLREAVFRLAYKAKVPVLQQKKVDLFLGTPNIGAVREGKNRVVAFYDLDNNGDYTPGEPLGFAENVDVGWKQGAAEMELTDTSSIITRAALRQDTENGGNEDGSGGVSTDRYVLYGSEDGDLRALMAGELSGGDYQRFRVVRTLVNGYSIDTLGVPNRVVVDKWLHLKQRPYFFEGDVLDSNEFDLDWSSFHEIATNKIVVANRFDITNVVYRIVLGNGTIDTTETNNLFVVATTRYFDQIGNRPVPTLLSPGIGGESIVYGSRPTFKWSMGQFNSYTAFQLQILKGGSPVWDSGVRKAPARDVNDVYTFVPDVYVGDVLEAGQKYTWRVAMLNAKFQDPDWEELAKKQTPQTFMMNPEAVGYGTIKVCARYFGPAAANSTVRVEAFETPDFTGDPVARTTATGADITTFGTLHKANATLIGLAPGTYYVRAYLDSNTHGVKFAKDAWESWGYACPREKSEQMFNPSSVVVAQDIASAQVILVNIEDVDQNGNKVPDAWEVGQSGKLDDGANRLGDIQNGGVIVNPALATLLEREGAKVPGGLASQVFAALTSEPAQAMIFGVNVPAGSTVGEVLMEASEVVDGSVAITGVTLNQAEKKVVLSVTADVENPYSNSQGASIYTFDGDVTDVTCVVYRKATLVQKDWDEVATKTVTVGREAADVEVDLSDVDLSSGFFKVELKK